MLTFPFAVPFVSLMVDFIVLVDNMSAFLRDHSAAWGVMADSTHSSAQNPSTAANEVFFK